MTAERIAVAFGARAILVILAKPEDVQREDAARLVVDGRLNWRPRDLQADGFYWRSYHELLSGYPRSVSRGIDARERQLEDVFVLSAAKPHALVTDLLLSS